MQGKGADLMDRKNFQYEGEYISFEDSASGKQFAELQKLRQDFDNYVAQQEAQRKADEERQWAERKRNTLVSLAAGSFTGVASGIFLYYWPNIIVWISSLVQ